MERIFQVAGHFPKPRNIELVERCVVMGLNLGSNFVRRLKELLVAPMVGAIEAPRGAIPEGILDPFIPVPDQPLAVLIRLNPVVPWRASLCY